VKIARLLTGAIAGILLAAGPALAQASTDAPAPAAPLRPEVKPVGDWFVRCYPVQSPSPCDVFQELDNQNTRLRVLTFSIAYAPAQDRHIAAISVPLEVSIPKGLVIQTDNFTSPVLRFRMCNRDGCYVQMVMDNAMIAALSKSGPAAKINVWSESGKLFPINFSLKGFAAAHDDMVTQARAKAKSAPAGAPAAAAKP
jgi:invasion protein IalB